MDTLLALLPQLAILLAAVGRHAGWWPHPVLPPKRLPADDQAFVDVLRAINRELKPRRRSRAAL